VFNQMASAAAYTNLLRAKLVLSQTNSFSFSTLPPLFCGHAGGLRGILRGDARYWRQQICVGSPPGSSGAAATAYEGTQFEGRASVHPPHAAVQDSGFVRPRSVLQRREGKVSGAYKHALFQETWCLK